MEVAAVAKRPFRVHRTCFSVIRLITNLHLKNKKAPSSDYPGRGGPWCHLVLPVIRIQ